MTVMDEQAVFEKVKAALQAFLKEDQALLHVKASERSMSHKFAEHLQRQFADLAHLKVDCEYNRHGEETKILEYGGAVKTMEHNWQNRRTRIGAMHARTVFPDIIVHQRGKDNQNLLVIEIKKSNSKAKPSLDFEKLRGFTRKPYNYQHGIFLIFDVRKGSTTRPIKDIKYFRGGEETPTSTIWTTLKELGYGG